jgi:hypothetical protein
MSELQRVRLPRKHIYVLGLDDVMKKRIELLRKPYPKRATSETVDTLADQVREGGLAPTVALHLIDSQIK